MPEMIANIRRALMVESVATKLEGVNIRIACAPEDYCSRCLSRLFTPSLWSKDGDFCICILEICIETLVEDAVRRLLARNVSVDVVPLFPLTGQPVRDSWGAALCKPRLQGSDATPAAAFE